MKETGGSVFYLKIEIHIKFSGNIQISSPNGNSEKLN